MKNQVHDIYKNVIQKYLNPTPLKRSEWLSTLVNGNVYLKLENENPNGSFKVRGALNAISNLSEKYNTNQNRPLKIVAASAGNHAQGVGFAAKQLGCEAHIFLPKTASALKRKATEKLGANIYLVGNNFEDAMNAAQEFCQKENAHFIHAFDNEDIILGQATCALEAHMQLQNMQQNTKHPSEIELNYFLCSIGGGGLASGACIYFSSENKTKVIGVEQELYNSAFNSLQKHELAKSDVATSTQTIADGIAVKMIGPRTFYYLSTLLEKVTLVSEHDIHLAVAKLYKHENLIVEGSGAAPVAAILKNPQDYQNKTTIICVSGGNIDPEVFQNVLETTKDHV